jgi:hypothetical protein
MSRALVERVLCMSRHNGLSLSLWYRVVAWQAVDDLCDQGISLVAAKDFRRAEAAFREVCVAKSGLKASMVLDRFPGEEISTISSSTGLLCALQVREIRRLQLPDLRTYRSHHNCPGPAFSTIVAFSFLVLATRDLSKQSAPSWRIKGRRLCPVSQLSEIWSNIGHKAIYLRTFSTHFLVFHSPVSAMCVLLTCFSPERRPFVANRTMFLHSVPLAPSSATVVYTPRRVMFEPSSTHPALESSMFPSPDEPDVSRESAFVLFKAYAASRLVLKARAKPIFLSSRLSRRQIHSSSYRLVLSDR